MDKFDRELKNVLMKRLPQSTDYGWSRRIEGALERSESSAAHDDVAIIVDSEISSDEYAVMADRVYQFIKSDEYFRQSYYRILLWKQDGLSLISPKRISNVGQVKHFLDEAVVNAGISCGWDEFWQYYKPHKKAGQVFLITTKEKVETMRESKAIGIRNLVVVYQGDEASKIKEAIMSIPCIAHISSSTEG